METREERLYRKAKKKVAKKKGFYRHLQVYVVVNVFVLLINLYEGQFWDAAPMPLAWGMGLAMHYFSVFGMPGGKMTDEWEDQEIEKEMRKMQNKTSYGRSLPPSKEELDLDDHLDLREPRKMKDYDDRDFV